MLPNFFNHLEEMRKKYKEQSKEEQRKQNREYLIELLEDFEKKYTIKCEFEHKSLMESFREYSKIVEEKERIESILTELKEE